MVNFKCGIAFTLPNVFTKKQFYKEIKPTFAKILFIANLSIVKRESTNLIFYRGSEYDK